MVAAVSEITIRKEFASLIPAISDDELEQLHKNLDAEGCLDPLIVWDQGDKLVLLDGHNRYKWCRKNGVGYAVKRLKFASVEAAKDWIINHQLGRRNITDEQRRYLIGKLYLQHKPPQGAHVTAKNASSATVADEHGVSKRTVHNAAEYAEAVDAIGEKSPDLKAAVLAGEVKATAAQLETLAEAPKRKVEAVAKRVERGDANAVKEAVREAGDDTESEAEAERALQAKRRTNGREKVSPLDRKAAIDCVKKLVRLTDDLGIHEKCRGALERILAEIKSA